MCLAYICIFLPLLLFLDMVSRYPAVHHHLATVMFVDKKDNKLMNKNLSPNHSITGPDLNLCFGPNNGDFVLCTFFCLNCGPDLVKCVIERAFVTCQSIMLISMSFGVRSLG